MLWQQGHMQVWSHFQETKTAPTDLKWWHALMMPPQRLTGAAQVCCSFTPTCPTGSATATSTHHTEHRVIHQALITTEIPHKLKTLQGITLFVLILFSFKSNHKILFQYFFQTMT